jgi:PEP-CTERM motif
VFVETLTAVDSINRLTPDQVIVHLSGTVSDSQGLFVDTPAFFVLNATQFDGVGTATSVTFTNSTGAVTPSVPEPSTWVMMTLGFGVLGYAAFRRRGANVAALFP